MMRPKQAIASLLLPGLCLVIVSCLSSCISEGDPDNNNQLPDITNSTEMPDSSTGSGMKVYTLPAPLQVATAIKLYDINYSEELLLPLDRSTAKYTTSYRKAVNLGILGINMGYTTLYENHAKAAYYGSMIQNLAEELDITAGFKPAMLKRFEANKKNQDSLYIIILEAFDQAHGFLQENQREDVGLLISAGVLIEGMYLSTNFAQTTQNKEVNKLVLQQQNYLQNVIDLLTPYSDQSEVANLLTGLNNINATFEEAKQNGRTRLTPASLDKIMAAVTQVREPLVN